MRLILVRHGETDWNAEKRYQGQADVPLNRTGRRQAAALARRLAGEPIHALYTSDLARAAATAQAIGRPHGLSPRAGPRLREMDFGAWEGLTYAQIQERDAAALDAWMADPLGFAPPEGESLAQLADRVDGFWEALVSRHATGTVVVVAHGGPLRVMICRALGLPPEAHWRWGLDVAALAELQGDGEEMALMRLNDVSHLRDIWTAETAPSQTGSLTLVLGGARSGKSTFAEQLAGAWGGDDVLYVATAQAGDEEMQERIRRHRQQRPAHWRTLEARRDAGQAIAHQAADASVILVECLTLLVSNVVVDVYDKVEDAETNTHAPEDEAQAERAVLAEVQALVDVARCPGRRVIVVSNEVGLGVVPPYLLGRVYRDLLGRANQILARHANAVYFLAAGIPKLLKGKEERSI
jgi:alpha-ribazole phosphatase